MNPFSATYEMISSEGNTVGKAVAITGGGLLGLLVASRKGFFKKLFYTSAGLTAATAACYPKEAKELSEIGLFIIKTKGPELIKEYTGISIDISNQLPPNLTIVFRISGIDLSKKKESPTKTEPKSFHQIGQEVSDVMYYGFRVSESVRF